MTYIKLEQEKGYILGYALTKEEHSIVVSWIRDLWESRILSCYPELGSTISTLALQDYHKLDGQIKHEILWEKKHRIFSKKQANMFQNMSIFSQLQSDLGDVFIADIEGLGYPELYWRLVRPKPHIDVSEAHADAWFYSITNNINKERQRRLCKFWLSIHTTASQSGLSVHAGSHKLDWKYSSEIRHGRPKPIFLDDPNRLCLQNLPLNNGEGVVFHPQLIHQGIAHHENKTRYSIECALEIADG